MKYKDLIQFEPIERVVQLKDANHSDKAGQFVSTYVISDIMADTLSKKVVPLLDPNAADAKGLLIVGNYGTGKSHLMSVISSICEYPDVADLITNSDVKESAKKVTGEYKVIRMEIGSTKMGLRNIITKNIESQLREWEIDFQFPAEDEITENKSSIEDLMVAFQGQFSDKGLLIVVDELLDYLRSRNQQEITLDFGFLREIAEVCAKLKFRIIAGVQEAIFDSDRFAFVSESLARVKERFDDVRIQKTDITFVVANRLLKKTDEQKSQIRDYLAPFAKFYNGWTEKLDDFVDLFPVHPDYVDTFEKLPIVEQRGVLQVLSDNFIELQDKELPSDYPGILALDSFWAYLKGNAVHRANEDVKATMDCSDILHDKVNSGFPKKRETYKPIAKRIIDGLSVNRLTTANINAPIGMTSEQLRDELCVYHPMVEQLGGEQPSDDLLTVIETTLKEIRTCVSGQFLSANDDNHQYYLDLKKTEDFDALIEKRAESLDDNTLDSAYFHVLQQTLEIDAPSDFTGYHIWESNIPWAEKNVSKLGWLFFGVPSERSTAQPARDFYLYFPQIISPPKFKDEQKDDEVFFRLDAADQEFRKSLDLYAAAIALKQNATGTKKSEYDRKAEKHFRTLTQWVQTNFLSKLKVTFAGKTQSLSQALAGQRAANLTCREQINLAASSFLNPHFGDLCGEYPKFNRPITFGKDGNANRMITDALAYFSGAKSQTAETVLDGLGMLDGETINANQSPYAQYIISLLSEKGQGQVLNASELIQEIDTVPYFSRPEPGSFRLEVELLLVVLTGLVYSGDIVLSVPGKEFSATDLAELSKRPLADLKDFKHIKMPKDWNVPAIKALYQLLDLSPGLAVQVTQNNNEAVIQLNTELTKKVEALVMARQEFGNGVPFWGVQLMEEAEVTKLTKQLDDTKQFLESLQSYTTPAKLKNFKYSAEDVNAHQTGIQKFKEMQKLKDFANSFTELTSYLSNATANLAEDHAWSQQCSQLKKTLISELNKPENREDATFLKKTKLQLEKLKKEYISIYLALYQSARLNMQQDGRKKTLLQGMAMQHLNKLSTVPTMNVSQLTEIREELGKLKTGATLSAHDLETTPIAGEFYPSMEGGDGISADQRLANLETKVEAVYQSWVQSLLDEFDDPSIRDHIKLLKPKEKTALDTFLTDKELPAEIPSELLSAMNQALSGLTSITVSLSELEQKLFTGGSAATLDDFESRFQDYLKSISKGHDRAKVRLVLGSSQEPNQ
jgi:hypothetical protein